MGYDQTLAGRVRKLLHRLEGFSEREMFGGVGFMLHGNMSCGINGHDLIVRVGPEAYDHALSEPHVRVFDMTDRPMRGWVVVDKGGVETDDALKAWVEKGSRFARSLPAK
jgi:TfoX/Sxy family transcriptional regulator of competence genes